MKSLWHYDSRVSATLFVLLVFCCLGYVTVLLARQTPSVRAQGMQPEQAQTTPTAPAPSVQIPVTGEEIAPAAVSGPDIRGGREATPGAWPWQAALVRSSYENAYSGQFCGGTLIDPEWVLTAAHCVEDMTTNGIDVVLGRHQLSLDDGVRISVTEIVVHPDYFTYSFANDLALLRLRRAATQTVMTLDASAAISVERRALNATVIGWGATDDSSYGSDVIREVTLPFVSLETCRDAHYYGAITDGMVCAGYEKGAKSACYGDSGGPLMIATEATSGWTQVGIVSWGRYGCSGSDNYNVYTRVASYSEWIQACMTGGPESDCAGGDAFEPDDEMANATLITTDGISQTHNFHGLDDRDWLKFVAKAGTPYQMETFNLGSNSDTILWLYDADGITALGYNDDRRQYTSSSQLAWTAPADGTYYIQVDNHWQGRRGGTYYSVRILELTSQLFLPSVIHQRPTSTLIPTQPPGIIILPTPTPAPTLLNH